MLDKRLRELRTDAGLTQTELGKRVGVIKQTVSSWENNTSTPNYEIVLKLAEIFEVSTDYILGRSNEKGGAMPPEYLTSEEGNRIVQEMLKDTGLLAPDGTFTDEGYKIVSDFIRSNADMLKKLIKEHDK